MCCKSCAKTKGMTFGEAIEALKQGKKVARAGWNGRGMYIWMKPAFNIKPEMCSDPMLKQAVIDNGGELLGLPTLSMFTHDSTGRKAVLSGWLASQSDMLLEDWEIFEPVGVRGEGVPGFIADERSLISEEELRAAVRENADK